MINKTLLNWINTESNLHLWVVISSVYLLFSRDAGVFDPWPGLPTHPISSLSRQEENTASHSKSGLLFRTEVECTVVLKVPSGALSQSQKSRAPFTHPWRLVLTCPLSLQGLGLRDELASRGYKEEKRGSHGAEEFQEQKEGRSKQRQQVFTASHRAADPASQNGMLYGPTWSKMRQGKMTDRILDWLPSAFVPRKAEVEEWGWKLKPKRYSWPACNRHWATSIFFFFNSKKIVGLWYKELALGFRSKQVKLNVQDLLKEILGFSPLLGNPC